MEPYLQDADVTLYVGDALEVLHALPDESVHAIASSPPFFGLRDYATGIWEGGDPACLHEVKRQGGAKQTRASQSAHAAAADRLDRERCRCGAHRVDRQIGRELTPQAWAEALVAVFREARRVLRSDGTLWVECGDSYASKPRGSDEGWSESRLTNPGRTQKQQRSSLLGGERHRGKGSGLKEKDLVLAPALLAMALREDGWVLRGFYPWWKPDAMPESIADRCTVDYAVVMHLAKSNRQRFWQHRGGVGTRRRPKPDYVYVDRLTGAEFAEPGEGRKRLNLWSGNDYFFDQDAIREPYVQSTHPSGNLQRTHGRDVGLPPGQGSDRGRSIPWTPPAADVGDGSQLDLAGEDAEPEQRGPDGRRKLEIQGTHNSQQHRSAPTRWPSLEGRSPRAVWRIPTEASSFGLCPVCRAFWNEQAPARHCGAEVIAHFAVWPHALVEKIIKAATSEGGVCADCGAPRLRRVERGPNLEPDSSHAHTGDERRGHRQRRGDGVPFGTIVRRRAGARGEVLGEGWQPSCECGAETVPATVMDVFAGSGTTGRAARRLGRHAVLIELSPDYAEIAWHRLAQQSLLALEASA